MPFQRISFLRTKVYMVTRTLGFGSSPTNLSHVCLIGMDQRTLQLSAASQNWQTAFVVPLSQLVIQTIPVHRIPIKLDFHQMPAAVQTCDHLLRPLYSSLHFYCYDNHRPARINTATRLNDCRNKITAKTSRNRPAMHP